MIKQTGRRALPFFYSASEVASRYGVSKSFITKLAQRGGIGCLRCGRRLLFSEKHLLDYERENERRMKRGA